MPSLAKMAAPGQASLPPRGRTGPATGTGRAFHVPPAEASGALLVRGAAAAEEPSRGRPGAPKAARSARHNREGHFEERPGCPRRPLPDTMRTTRRKQSAPLCISGNEMERLRSFTRPPPKKEEDLRNEHLKKLSEDRVKNWPNTLAAQRKKKEQWKEIRAAEEEAYRVKVDNEERELREAAAAKAYAKAKYLKFENQDKTK